MLWEILGQQSIILGFCWFRMTYIPSSYIKVHESDTLLWQIYPSSYLFTPDILMIKHVFYIWANIMKYVVQKEFFLNKKNLAHLKQIYKDLQSRVKRYYATGHFVRYTCLIVRQHRHLINQSHSCSPVHLSKSTWSTQPAEVQSEHLYYLYEHKIITTVIYNIRYSLLLQDASDNLKDRVNTSLEGRGGS